MEAFPPTARALKLVMAPKPLRNPPATANVTTLARRCQSSGTRMTMPRPMSSMAKTNQKYDSSMEISFVASFCVTPLRPKNRRVMSAKTSHKGKCMGETPGEPSSLKAEEIDGRQGHAQPYLLIRTHSLVENHISGHDRDQGGQSTHGNNHRGPPPRLHGGEERDVPEAAQDSREESEEDPQSPLPASGHPRRPENQQNQGEHPDGEKNLIHIGIDIVGYGLGSRSISTPQHDGQHRIEQPLVTALLLFCLFCYYRTR